ncbi:hypothetical protein [Paenibacillus spiritus]|nr:hypothetical protein [Paenibacillus spiritus]
MRTIIRYRDENGNIVGSLSTEQPSSLIEVLRDFSIALFIVAIIIMCF